MKFFSADGADGCSCFLVAAPALAATPQTSLLIRPTNDGSTCPGLIQVPEDQMRGTRQRSVILITIIVGLLSTDLTMAIAEEGMSRIDNNDGILVDANAFTLTQRGSQKDVSFLVDTPGVHVLEAGAIIFRSGDKLYILEPGTVQKNSPDERQSAPPRNEPRRDQPPRPFFDDNYRRSPTPFPR